MTGGARDIEGVAPTHGPDDGTMPWQGWPNPAGGRWAESWCLMLYQGADGRPVWVWNSRDGYAPFMFTHRVTVDGVAAYRAGDVDTPTPTSEVAISSPVTHVRWESDLCVPAFGEWLVRWDRWPDDQDLFRVLDGRKVSTGEQYVAIPSAMVDALRSRALYVVVDDSIERCHEAARTHPYYPPDREAWEAVNPDGDWFDELATRLARAFRPGQPHVVPAAEWIASERAIRGIT